MRWFRSLPSRAVLTVSDRYRLILCQNGHAQTDFFGNTNRKEMDRSGSSSRLLPHLIDNSFCGLIDLLCIFMKALLLTWIKELCEIQSKMI
jgi:hypothetical protein